MQIYANPKYFCIYLLFQTHRTFYPCGGEFSVILSQRWNDQTSQTLQSQGILNFSHLMRRGRQLEFKLLIQYTFSVLWTPHQKPLSEPRAKVLFWEHFLYRPNGHKSLWHFPWYRGVARAWHPEGFNGNREFGALLPPKEGRSQQIICSFKPIGKEGWHASQPIKIC